jgi:hypothetical protein
MKKTRFDDMERPRRKAMNQYEYKVDEYRLFEEA